MTIVSDVSLAQGIQEKSLFALNLGSGARAFAMGGAFIAIADDATAASWNPAGLSILQQPEAAIVWQPGAWYTTAFSGKTTVESNDYSGTPRASLDVFRTRTDPLTQASKSHALEFASLTFPVRFGRIRLVPQINYQRLVDFGLDTRFIGGGVEQLTMSTSSFGTITRTASTPAADGAGWTQSGGIDVLVASLGLPVHKKLSLGLALNHWRGAPRMRFLSSPFPTVVGDGTLRTTELSRDDGFSGTSVNLGAILVPWQTLRIGLVYKSALSLKSKGVARIVDTYSKESSLVQVPDSSYRLLETNHSEDSDISWPATVGAGVAVRPQPSLTLAIDWTTSDWSKVEKQFRQAKTLFSLETFGGTRSSSEVESITHRWPTGYSASSPESQANPGQNKTRQLRVGLEYLVKPSRSGRLQAVPVRLGVFAERQLFKALPSLADVDYFGLTAGSGLVWSRLSIDFAYVRTSGDYKCCEVDFKVPIVGTTLPGIKSIQTVQDASDKFHSQRLYVSAIVRF